MAFLSARRDFIGVHPQTLYKGIFAGLLRFRHIIQFSPPSIIHIIQHNSFHVKYCHFIRPLFSSQDNPLYRPAVQPIFSKKHNPQHRPAPSQHLPTFQDLPTCENFNKLHRLPDTPTTRTHTTRAGKDSQ